MQRTTYSLGVNGFVDDTLSKLTQAEYAKFTKGMKVLECKVCHRLFQSANSTEVYFRHSVGLVCSHHNGVDDRYREVTKAEDEELINELRHGQATEDIRVYQAKNTNTHMLSV